MIVEYSESKNVDYLFHCDAKIITKLHFAKKKSFEEYPYFNNIKEVFTTLDYIIICWKLNKKILTSKIN